MSSSYEKAKTSKLTFKGGLGPLKKIGKKTRRKKAQDHVEENEDVVNAENVEAAVSKPIGQNFEIDTGTGHAPDGKKSKKYEELFPVETKRHKYAIPTTDSREAALDERVKKKADRYCK